VATMIPDIDPGLIENSGEQRFYEAACDLPAAYSVYYSYKFSAGEHAENPALIYEADFIIVHPHLGSTSQPESAATEGNGAVTARDGKERFCRERQARGMGAL